MTRFHKYMGALVGAAAALGLAQAAAAQPQPLKIGVIMPLTGELADYGVTSLNGIKLAAEEINKAGGVLGAPVTLAIGDDQTSPQSGVSAAQKLVSVEKASVLVGPMGSGVFIPVAKTVALPAGIPIITGSATSPVISTLDQGKGLVFRSVPSDAFQGVALADVAQNKGYKSVGVIYINNDYGKGLAENFQKSFAARGGKVTGTVGYEPKQPSFRGEVQKAATGKPEALLVIAYTGDGVPILKQALESGLFKHFLLSDGMRAPEIVETLGADFLEGAAGTSPSPLPGNPASDNFTAAYKAFYGENSPKPYIDTFYDATYIASLAAEQAKSTDPAKIAVAIRAVTNGDGEKVGPGEFAKAKDILAKGGKITYVGASGPIHFDANGDTGSTFAHWEITGGDYKTIRIFEPKP